MLFCLCFKFCFRILLDVKFYFDLICYSEYTSYTVVFSLYAFDYIFACENNKQLNFMCIFLISLLKENKSEDIILNKPSFAA